MKKIIIILLLSFFIGSSTYADVIENAPRFTYTYLFHLYYDNGQLLADRDYEFKYDLVAEEFVPETVNTQFPFFGEVINLKGETAAEFKFDPRRNDPSFLKGKISVKAPYVSDGQKVSFYDSQDNHLLTIFVSESSFCNDDEVCNEGTGENNQTCPNDCRLATPVPTPPIEGGGQNTMMNWLVYGLIITGAAFSGWYGWKWWKGRKAASQTPSSPVVPM